MTVDAMAAAIVTDALRPPGKGCRQQHRRCIYCTIVVGEAVTLRHGIEWETFVETDKGPVCECCMDYPYAQKQAGHAGEYIRRRAIIHKRVQSDCHAVTRLQREARDARIMQLHGNGWTYQRIAYKVGMTASGVGSAVNRMRHGS